VIPDGGNARRLCVPTVPTFKNELGTIPPQYLQGCPDCPELSRLKTKEPLAPLAIDIDDEDR